MTEQEKRIKTAVDTRLEDIYEANCKFSFAVVSVFAFAGRTQVYCGTNAIQFYLDNAKKLIDDISKEAIGIITRIHNGYSRSSERTKLLLYSQRVEEEIISPIPFLIKKHRFSVEYDYGDDFLELSEKIERLWADLMNGKQDNVFDDDEISDFFYYADSNFCDINHYGNLAVDNYEKWCELGKPCNSYDYEIFEYIDAEIDWTKKNKDYIEEENSFVDKYNILKTQNNSKTENNPIDYLLDRLRTASDGLLLYGEDKYHQELFVQNLKVQVKYHRHVTWIRFDEEILERLSSKCKYSLDFWNNKRQELCESLVNISMADEYGTLRYLPHYDNRDFWKLLSDRIFFYKFDFYDFVDIINSIYFVDEIIKAIERVSMSIADLSNAVIQEIISSEWYQCSEDKAKYDALAVLLCRIIEAGDVQFVKRDGSANPSGFVSYLQNIRNSGVESRSLRTRFQDIQDEIKAKRFDSIRDKYRVMYERIDPYFNNFPSAKKGS